MSVEECMARAIVRSGPGITQIGREDIDSHWPQGWEDLRKGALLQAAAAIAALADAGLEIRPREPTEAMMKEGADFLSITPGGATNECAGSVYRAMIRTENGP